MWNFSVVAFKIRTRTSHTTTWNLWVEGFCTSLTVLILGHLIQCQGDILNKNNGNGSGRCYSCFLHIACCWLRCVWRFLSSSCFQFNLEDSGILCKCCGLSFEANGASSIVESGWRMGQRTPCKNCRAFQTQALRVFHRRRVPPNISNMMDSVVTTWQLIIM